MIRLVLASNNQHKVTEIRNILPKSFNLIDLSSAGLHSDLPETTGTIKGNAIQKAQFVWEKLGVECIADDSGLEVDALCGRPGVDSAHYSGLPISAERNMDLLLAELLECNDTSASFVTILALVRNGEVFLFEGRIYGHITRVARGEAGFGYDPVFVPRGYSQTFAEMDPNIKNEISHRAIALHKLKAYYDSLIFE